MEGDIRLEEKIRREEAVRGNEYLSSPRHIVNVMRTIMRERRGDVKERIRREVKLYKKRKKI